MVSSTVGRQALIDLLYAKTDITIPNCSFSALPLRLRPKFHWLWPPGQQDGLLHIKQMIVSTHSLQQCPWYEASTMRICSSKTVAIASLGGSNHCGL